MINYENCIECGSCFDMCQHGVYKKEDSKPIVVYPEGCVEGCQSQCPAEAITYFGDNGEKESGGCGCGSCG